MNLFLSIVLAISGIYSTSLLAGSKSARNPSSSNQKHINVNDLCVSKAVEESFAYVIKGIVALKLNNIHLEKGLKGEFSLPVSLELYSVSQVLKADDSILYVVFLNNQDEPQDTYREINIEVSKDCKIRKIQEIISNQI